MKNTQTISDWTTSLASVVKADRKKGTTDASGELNEHIQTRLVRADARIATLEAELKKKEITLSALISEDVRSSQEISELQDMVWRAHRDLPEGCHCKICAEVERSHVEFPGLL